MLNSLGTIAQTALFKGFQAIGGAYPSFRPSGLFEGSAGSPFMTSSAGGMAPCIYCPIVSGTTGSDVAITSSGLGGTFLMTVGSNAPPTWNPINLGNPVSITGILPIAYGGTGLATYGAGQLLIGNSGGTLTPATLTAGTGIGVANGSGSITISLSTPVSVANGGTGQNTYTNGQLLIGNTTGNTLSKSTLTAGTGISVTNGAGTITIANTGGSVSSFSVGNLSPLFSTSVSNSTTTPALSFSSANAAPHTFLGNFTGSTGAYSFSSPALASADFVNQGTTTSLLHGNASGNPSWGAVNYATDGTGLLPVTNGGTGAATTTANYIFAGPDSSFNSGAPAAPSFRPMHPMDFPPMSRYSYFFTDLLGYQGVGSNSTSFLSDNLSAVTSGANSALVFGQFVANHPGVATLVTGTTTTGFVMLTTGSVVSTGNAGTYYETILSIPTLSTSAQRFFVRAGFSFQSGGGESSVIEFRYIDSLNSGNWQLQTSVSGTQTIINTSSAPVANTWYHLAIRVTANDSCIFYINGVNQGVITTNVPGSGVPLFCFEGINKVTGITSESLNVDAMEEYTYINR